MVKPTPPETVAMIKAILFQDKRERLAAGYRYQTRYITHRLAAAFGVSYDTVRGIKEGWRHHGVKANQQCLGLTVDRERLERIRRYNEQHLPPPRSPVPALHLQHYWKKAFRRVLTKI